MAIKLIATNGKITYEQNSYVCDEVAEINTLSTRCGMGSTAYVISTGQKYILNGAGTWVLYNTSNYPGNGQSGSNFNNFVQAITTSELDTILANNSLTPTSNTQSINMLRTNNLSRTNLTINNTNENNEIPVFNVEDIKTAIINNQQEITLNVNNDINIEEAIEIPSEKTIILNLNSNKLSGDRIFNVNGNLILTNGEIDGITRSIVINNGGSLIINNTYINSENDCAVSVSGGEVIMNSGKIEAQKVGIIAAKNSIITINDGILKSKDNFAIGGNGSAGQGGTTININGGYIEGNVQSAGYIACAIYHPNIGILNITNGEIVSNGGCGVLMRGGQLNMSGGSITAIGTPGLLGKVGNSNTAIGPYAIVYDQKTEYPAADTLNIVYTDGKLEGTEGKLSILVKNGITPNIFGLNY